MRMHTDHGINDQYRVPKPKRLSEVPEALAQVTVRFFKRLLYIFQLVWETKKSLLFLMLFMSVFNGVMPVAGALIAAGILNRLAGVYAGAELAFSAISVLLMVQFGYMFLSAAVSRLYDTIINVSGELVSSHVKIRIMEKAREVDMVCYDSPEFYARLENANREAGSRPLQIMSAAVSVLSALISMFSFVALLFSVSPWMPLAIILLAFPTTMINFIYRKKNANYLFRRSKDRRQMEYYASTVVNKDLVKEVRMFNLADTFCDKYKRAFETYFKGLKRLQIGECLWNVGVMMLTNTVYCLMYLYLARGVYAGEIAVGSFSLYTGAITAIGGGVSSLISTTASIYEGTLFIHNLISFLEQEPSIVPLTDQPLPVKRRTEHCIQFQDVSFHYPGADQEVLSHIDLTIRPGETVVIVGLNGAGKTTLIKLLTRLYDPTGGRILLDGRDIREYDVAQLYQIFGIIFQDYGRYAVTAGENISFGDVTRGTEPEAIHAAAEQSGADAFIQRLPKRYDTALMRYFEDNGIELSIGQWQKLAIARAFYSDSDILILDEPTASLDPIAEQDIFNQFDRLREDKISIFISHRLSSATIADQILVMEYGRIVESGSHETLMRARGKYHNLFTTQAKRYIASTQGGHTEEEFVS